MGRRRREEYVQAFLYRVCDMESRCYKKNVACGVFVSIACLFEYEAKKKKEDYGTTLICYGYYDPSKRKKMRYTFKSNGTVSDDDDDVIRSSISPKRSPPLTLRSFCL